MSRLLGLFSSSIGKKYLMAITGLLLCGFLVLHMGGNVYLFVGEQEYNDYAHGLHEKEWLVKLVEAGLVVLFVLHIWFALSTTKRNWQARKKRYAEKRSKIEDPILHARLRAENWMLISGLIVLGFLIWHLLDFTWEVTPPARQANSLDQEPYAKAVTILLNPVTSIVYIIGPAVLGWHLAHGFASAFQSLGLNHPTFNRAVRVAGLIFAVLFGLAFAVFPIAVIAGWIG
ncbi:MAG: succinate dehydrogenase cytochrome b subunit [Planctomycetaceae bacterium]